MCGIMSMQLPIDCTMDIAEYRFAPSQWEMAFLCIDVSHWLGAGQEPVLIGHRWNARATRGIPLDMRTFMVMNYYLPNTLVSTHEPFMLYIIDWIIHVPNSFFWLQKVRPWDRYYHLIAFPLCDARITLAHWWDTEGYNKLLNSNGVQPYKTSFC